MGPDLGLSLPPGLTHLLQLVSRPSLCLEHSQVEAAMQQTSADKFALVLA